ncbi:MAG: hypothetical protein GXZ07_10055 [Firmicutes bacterium]|nr:hypothetical protein [Bacillota bacterium]
MRIAVLVIGLIFMIIIGVQGCLVGAGGTIFGDEELSGGGGIGMFASLLFGVAAAFVMAKPVISVVIFILAALLAFLAGTTGFSDMNIWGVLALLLAVLSYFGHRELLRKQEKNVIPK